MRKVIYITLVFGVLLVASGCRAVRTQKSTDHHTATVDTSYRSHFERLYIELRDSLVYLKAPVEKSESRGLQYSLLETSLARSAAAVDSAGILSHSINNKDSIPSRIIYKNVYHTLYDTVFISHSDTVRLAESEYVEKGLTFMQQVQIRGFWILLCIVAVIALGAIVKSKLKHFL